MKEMISIFNLNGGASIWWEDLKEIKGLKKIKITWKNFDKYFQKEYPLEKCYDENIKEFHDHKLGKIPWMHIPKGL
jgi:hypothetical protein